MVCTRWVPSLNSRPQWRARRQTNMYHECGRRKSKTIFCIKDDQWAYGSLSTFNRSHIYEKTRSSVQNSREKPESRTSFIVCFTKTAGQVSFLLPKTELWLKKSRLWLYFTFQDNLGIVWFVRTLIIIKTLLLKLVFRLNQVVDTFFNICFQLNAKLGLEKKVRRKEVPVFMMND